MFGLEDSRRYYVCQRYVRMNMGINGLSRMVSNELKQPVLSGDVFIFFGKSRQMVKLLCWDGDGFLLYQKRLEKGTFELPLFKAGQKALEMPYRTLSAIMRGVSLKSVRYRSRLRIGKS
jgi:transposase